MRTATTTFYCDASRCPAKFTAPREWNESTAGYLDLLDAGWSVERGGTWKHFCPEHREESSR